MRFKKLFQRKLREIQWFVNTQTFSVTESLQEIRRAVERLQYTVHVTSQERPASDVFRSMVRIDYPTGDKRYIELNDVTIAESYSEDGKLLLFLGDGGSEPLTGEAARRVAQALDKGRVKYEVEVYGE